MAKKQKRHYDDQERYYLRCVASLKGMCNNVECNRCVFNDEEKGCRLDHAPENWNVQDLYD